MADSFAKLFRKSSWAHFDSSLNRIYRAPITPPPSRPFEQPAPLIHSARPVHFGFKRDLPSTYFGKSLESVIMHRQDGDFGQSEISAPGRTQTQLYKVLMEAKEALETKTQIPFRILNPTSSSGWAVGIGGVVGVLPTSDIPDGFRFTRQDTLQRKAYWGWVKEVRADGGNGRPVIYVSLKKPVNTNKNGI